MSTAMALSDLMIAVRQRADMLPSGYAPSLTGNTGLFIPDQELISYLNQSAFELYDILVESFGDNYYVAPAVPFQTDGVNSLFALPNGVNFSSAPALYKLLGVDLQLNGAANQWKTLKTFQFSERNRMSYPVGIRTRGLRYCLAGSNVMLEPLPASGLTLQLWYVPRLTPLAALSDTLDGISGWTEYVIVDAAIKCTQKEEGDMSALLAQKDRLRARITEAAENRDAGEPFTVADTARYFGGDGFGGDGDRWF